MTHAGEILVDPGSGCPPRVVCGLCCVLLALQSAAAAAPVLQARAPAWTWAPPTGIEWCQVVECSGGPALLCATPDGALQIINVRDGGERLVPSIAAQPGVRWAAGMVHADPVYCFDRFSVYAVSLSPQVGLRWQRGAWREGLGAGATPASQPPPTFQGDPEELRRNLAAAATDDGVIVVRDDGRVGLFDRSDGHLRWEARTAASSSVFLSVRRDTAALVWREGACVAAALIDASTGSMQEVPLSSDAPLPLWTALTPAGLCVAASDSVWLWSPDGARRWTDLSRGARILAASIVLVPPSKQSHASASPELLIFATTDGRIRALDPATGAMAWDIQSPVGGDKTSVRLVAQDDRLTILGEQAVHFCDAATGRLFGWAALKPGEDVLDVRSTQRTTWLLKRVRSADGDAVRLEAYRPTKTPTSAPQPARARYDLGPADPFLSATWLTDRVVVATRRGLGAFDVMPCGLSAGRLEILP